jgi:hypothetical protein
MVVFNFSKRYRGKEWLRSANARYLGVEGSVAISGSWNIAMEELADMLNRYRERHGAV